MNYSSVDTQFGPVNAAFDDQMILQCLVFGDLRDLQSFFPNIEFRYNSKLSSILDGIIKYQKTVSFKANGTSFQQKVWNALLDIPFGQTQTYLEVARRIGSPSSVRAVATAIGKNPISYIIPCHRVVASNGTLGGYRWGLKIKQDLLNYERC